MSSRSLAAARARRTGENVAPVSGNRPVTSIGSQAAFAQQLPHGINYNTPPPPNNVRTARSIQPAQNQYKNQPQPQSNGLPFNKLSISDAIGLITLRLGRVEQWIIDTDNENDEHNRIPSDGINPQQGHTVIDNATLTTIINRIDLLEKNKNTDHSTEDQTNLIEEVKLIKEQLKRVSDDVSKHTIELSKNTEQVFKFNRELTETKDILKSFMIKYDLFSQETSQNFVDYEAALEDLEKRLSCEDTASLKEGIMSQEQFDNTDEALNRDVEEDNEETKDHEKKENNTITKVNLKNIIKEELSKT